MNASAYIHQVVNAFYDQAKTDVMIGYHFRHIPDFDTHLTRIHAFWEGQLLGLPPREQAPFDLIRAHKPLGIRRGEVGRWVMLFLQTLRQTPAAPPGLVELWEQKIKHFQEVFLRSPQLFP